MHPNTYEGMNFANRMTVQYTGSDTLRSGMLITQDVASTGLAADVTSFTTRLGSTNGPIEAARQGRIKLFTRPTIAAILNRGIVGVVVDAPPDGVVGNGVSVPVNIIPVRPDGAMVSDVALYTDQNVAIGDVLGPIPGSYIAGRAVIPGSEIFQARVAQDRSTTAGLVNGTLGFVPPDLLRTKIARIFNHWLPGDAAIGISGFTPAETAAFGHILRGSSAAAAYSATEHGGAVTVTPNTTNIGQLEQTGLPCVLASGRSAFFRARYKVANVDADTYFGLGINAAAVLTDGGYISNLDDYFGFVSDGDTASGAVLKFAYNKDNGTDRAITVLSSLASDTYIDVAALIVNRRAGTTASSGAKYGKVFYAGASGDLAMLTGTASPSVGTDVTADGTIDLSDLFNDDEAMGLAIASIGGTARAITLDRWELSFNV